MWRKPSTSASSFAHWTASGVFFSVGVMMKLAGAKLTSAACSTLEVSRPAIGWLAMNSTPAGHIACTGSTRPVLTPETSVKMQPGLRREPYVLNQSMRAVGYRPKMMWSACATRSSKSWVLPLAI